MIESLHTVLTTVPLYKDDLSVSKTFQVKLQCLLLEYEGSEKFRLDNQPLFRNKPYPSRSFLIYHLDVCEAQPKIF